VYKFSQLKSCFLGWQFLALNLNPEVRINMLVFVTARRRIATLKAPEGWRTPKRFAPFAADRERTSVLDCGGPLPLLRLIRLCED
jgi:hypothetical protein